MSTEIFNLKTAPLSGSNLLEAGAGTGKTYSLAYLYLRLLLEKGLLVDEILVTTFTLAATAELKGRIFDTIQHAERYFSVLSDGNAEEISALSDDFLCDLLQDIRAQLGDDTLLRQRFRLALTQFDYAQISTINGFALQLLREHSDVLDSYAPQEILNDDDDYVKRAYLALARDNFAELGEMASEVGRAVATFNSKELFALLGKLLRYDDYINRAKDALFAKEKNLSALIDSAHNSDHAGAIALIADAIAKKQLNGRSYPRKKLDDFAAKLDDKSAYCNVSLLTFFAHSNLLARRNKGATATFDHPFFTVCDELLAQADDLSTVAHIDKYRALLALKDALKTRVDTFKAEQMALTHDDIVRRVAHGASAIKTLIKCALIDEAQDTNSEQMQLFRTLFLAGDGDKITFFVGDPKQAIYGFRGANLFSYLAIQNEVEHHYIMDTNYRSTEALNASVNTFFGGENPFLNKDVSYHQINWKTANDASDFGDKSLTFVTAENGKVETLAQTGAGAIAALLHDYDIAPKDIAVLTRTGAQATAVKTALSQHGLSASLTGKLSLYESDEAKLLLALLKAVHSGSARPVKSLMLTPLFNASLDDANDSDCVNHLRARLHAFAPMYDKNGFSVMFYHLMNELHLAGQLLQATDGKRRLTNFIQLFELQQQISQQQSLSLAGLCDRLGKQIHDAGTEAELRLEDKNAITIMTMHNAKGLEFPVVCLPFFDYHNKRGHSNGLLVSHQLQDAAPAFLNPAHLKRQVEDEERAESRRLAYVALTRAKYHNLIIRQPEKTKNNGEMLQELLQTLADPTQLTQADFVAEPPQLPDIGNKQTETQQTTYQAKQLQKPLYSAWQLESFSRLQQQVSEHNDFIPMPENHADNGVVIDSALMQYPSGARPGTALHEMYEHYLATRQNDDAFHTAIDNSIDKHLYAADKQSRPQTPALANAVIATTQIPLAPQSFCLQDVALDKQSIEMKFFMHLSPAARQRLLAQFGLAFEDTQIIPTDGYVHGYIDYCFEHDGKFYVLDYKSNRLGETIDDYNRERMQSEMQHHRYDLQALIYTLALCKHLRIKTQADYDAKIGGYFYLFVRGMVAGNDSGIYADKVDWGMIAGLIQ